MGDFDIVVTEQPDVEVIAETAPGVTVSVAVPSPPEVVTVEIPGPPGPPGPPGGDKYYLHTQDSPSDTWEYEHNMGRRPAVHTFGTDGVEIDGDVSHIDLNNVRVEFGGPISGIATNS